MQRKTFEVEEVDPVESDKTNGERVKRMADRFRSAIEDEHRAVFYKSNVGYVVAGLVLSIVVTIAALALSGPVETTLVPLIPLGFIGIVVTVLLVNAAKLMHEGIAPVVATDTAVAQALTDDEDMLKAVHELSRSIF